MGGLQYALFREMEGGCKSRGNLGRSFSADE
jgi:hypothetical protein